jgi:hypothetical protein
MPQRAAPLSENKVNSAKATGRTYRLFDGGGLFLLVTPAGGKWWRFKYRFEGKAKTLSFGVYPEISLDDARNSRDDARILLSQGIDPSAVRREEKEREKAERLEAERTPSVRIGLDGKIEIRKGGNFMRLKGEEARFIANLLNKILG